MFPRWQACAANYSTWGTACISKQRTCLSTADGGELLLRRFGSGCGLCSGC